MAGGTTKSLGRLTVDLVAKVGLFEEGMTKSEKLAKENADKLIREEKRKKEEIEKLEKERLKNLQEDQRKRVAAEKEAAKELQRITKERVKAEEDYRKAVEENARKVEQRKQEMAEKLKTSAKAIGQAFTIAFTAASAVAISSIRETVQQARDLEVLTQISNSSSEAFQKMAAGARNYGIQQDKLGDMLKDFNERIGEFAQNKSGPMTDFFENIAPLVGVTIEQFQKLSGPEALQLYYNSLEQAGLTSQEMSFYLETMASDLTNLIPLLADNGREAKILGDQFEESGAMLDEAMIQRAKEAEAQMLKFQDRLRGVKVEIANNLIPYLMELSTELEDSANSFSLAETGANAFIVVLNALKGTLEVVNGGIQATIGWIGGIANASSIALAKVKGDTAAIAREQEKLKNSRRTFWEGISGVGEGIDTVFSDPSEAKRNADRVAREKNKAEQNAANESVKIAEEEQRRKTMAVRRSLLQIDNEYKKLEKERDKEQQKRDEDFRKEVLNAQKSLEIRKDTTNEERVLWETQKGRYKDYTAEQKQELLNYARQQDALEEQEKKLNSTGRAASDKSSSVTKGLEEERKLLDQVNKQLESQIATLEKEIALFGNDSPLASLQYDLQNTQLSLADEELKNRAIALTQQKEQLEIEKEITEEREEQERLRQEEIESVREHARQVISDLELRNELLGKTREEQEKILLLKDLELIKNEELAQKAIETLEKTQQQIKETNAEIEMADTIRDSFGTAFKDVVSGAKSFKDAMTDALDTIRQKILDMITERLMDQLFGQRGTSMGGFVGGLGGGNGGNWFGSFVGALTGRASGGYVAPNSIYRVNENDTEMLTIGNTDLLLTGSQGGVITPNHIIRNNSNSVSQVVNFTIQGKIDRRTEQQIANEVGRKASQASRRNS